jgi:hypothetical protein
VHEPPAGQFLAEHRAQHAGPGESADPLRPAPAHRACIEELALDAPLPRQQEVDAAVLPPAEKERVGQVVDPRPHDGAELSWQHG